MLLGPRKEKVRFCVSIQIIYFQANFENQTIEGDKIEVSLGRQTKINDFFASNRLSKSSILGKKSATFTDLSSSPVKKKLHLNNQENSNSNNDIIGESRYKSLMANGPFLREAINFENKSRNFEEEECSSAKSSPKFRTKPCPSEGRLQSIELFGLNKTNEHDGGSKIKNMILSYTNKYTTTKENSTLIGSSKEQNSEKSEAIKPREVKEEKEKVVEARGRNNNMSKSQPLGNNAPSKDRKSVSKLENILFKCFGTKNPTKTIPEGPPAVNKLTTKSHSSKDALENNNNGKVERTYHGLKKDASNGCLGDQKPQNDSLKMEVGKESKTIITPFGRVTCFNSVKTFSNLQPSTNNTQLPSLKITGSSEQAVKNRELINRWLKESVSTKTKRTSMSIEEDKGASVKDTEEGLRKTTRSEKTHESKPKSQAKMTNDKGGVSTRSSRGTVLESKDKEPARRTTTSKGIGFTIAKINQYFIR